MEKIFSYLTKNFVSVLGITILTGTTLTTSALGVMKVANNFEKIKLEVPEVKDIESTPTSVSPTPEINSSNQPGIPHPKGAVLGTKTTNTFSVIPTVIPTTAVAQANSNTSTSQCTISLFGKQYDVTNLRNTHSGGNIFNCGTDMTTVYQARHGTDMTRMQQYLIASGGTTSSSGTNTGSNGNSGGSTSSSGSNSSNNSSSGASTPQIQPTSTPQKIENHKEENDNEKENEIHSEDHKEEEKTHTESFLQRLLKLVIS